MKGEAQLSALRDEREIVFVARIRILKISWAREFHTLGLLLEEIG